MKSYVKFLLGLIFSLLALGSSSYARELDNTNIALICPIDATFCDLSNRGITSIASGTFVNHTSLQTLDLYSNQITSIESGDFAGLTSLSYLYLYSNQITSIESGDFAGLTSLQTLDLYGNQITSIENGDFDGLTSVNNLGLGENQITSIENGDFAGLTSLQILYLSSNQITSIESGDFAGLTSLASLNLESNQITSIESGDFAGLTSLTYLTLYANCLNTEDTIVSTYLDTLPGIDYSNQLICLQTQYSPSTSTSGPVTGSLSFVGPTSMVDALLLDNPNFSSYGHVFTGNGSHVYDYSSLIDNGQSVLGYDYLRSRFITNNYGTPRPDTVTGIVTWIIPDTTPPLGTLSYSTTGITNQSVIATLSLNESGAVTNNSGSTSYIFSGNGEFIFEYQDSVGNTGAMTASVTWIDTTPPTITLNGSGTLSGYVGTSYTDAGATWNDVVDGTGTLIGSGIVDTALAGTYIITYTVTDTAGNTSTTNRTITISNKPTSGGGGGGFVSKDNCPNGDYTSSYYDNKCGIKPTTSTGIVNQTGITTKPVKGPIDKNTTGATTSTPSAVIENPTVVQEKAYKWALSEGITTVETIKEARLDTGTTRAELAKMLSVYATDVLGKTVVKSDKECIFEDRDQANKGLIPYIQQACQLEIMGLESDGKTPLAKFKPNSYVTRAEFGTVLSRTLYGNQYDNNNNTKWREEHLYNLQQKNIISVITPTLQERRGWVMTMLYKTEQ